MPSSLSAPLQPLLLRWGQRTRRDLPWRRTRDPWAVLVSELMLQQTQVARVLPRYCEFLARFPSPAACAAAPVGDVVRAWAGLGYNRRAVQLHRTAVAVVERFAGALPSTLEQLCTLPGVGPYTGRAVLAFALEADVGVVDTNVARVLARAVEGRPLRAKEVQARADSLVPEGQGWAWNSTLIDLGATVCTRRSPRCPACPLAAAGACAWAAAGGTGPDPADGSAGVGRRQSVFAGSERQGRGRLVDALRRGAVPLGGLAVACGWAGDPDRAHRVADQLVAEGLAVVDRGRLRLP